MKKIFLFLAASLLLVSCSDDSETQEKLPALTKVTFTNQDDVTTRAYELTYDSKRRVKTVIRSIVVPETYTFFYHNDSRVNYVVAESTGAETRLLYDANENVIGFDVDGVVRDITYEPETQLYFIEGGIYFSFTDAGDFAQVSENWLGEFDNTKKGPFANVNSYYGFVIATVDNYMRNFMSVKALVQRTGLDGGVDTFENTYNENDQVIASQLLLDGTTPNLNIDYEYQDK